jgi:CheY-like chemotaxis protein
MDVSCLEGLRVLVVEDEVLIAMAHETILKGHGCTVAGIASTVAQALNLIDAVDVDAVLLDGNLNAELSAPVAAALEARGVPYLLVTGYVRMAVQDPVLARAPRVEKPFRAPQLSSAMVKVFC